MIEIPGYKIKKAIGKGGMATVYLAIHERLQREVALKVMAPESAATKVFQDSFLSEGRIIAKLEHPHIVKINDIDTQNGHFYMSMELLNNGSLKQHLADGNGKLPLAKALKITTQLADALSYAHQKNYIHRDIKPANILFRDDGSAVLTDFGVAKQEGTLSEMTKIGYMSGTPHYMSPEHALGSHEIDYRSDIYSLGIVFYEMLTGVKPFTGDSTIAVVYEHVNSDIPTLKGKHAIFQPVLNKALAKQAEDRFDDIKDFSQALQDVLQLPRISFFRKITNHDMLWLWLLAIVLIPVSAMMGYYYYTTKTETDSQSSAPIAIDAKQDVENNQHSNKQGSKEEIKAESEVMTTMAVEKEQIQAGRIDNHRSLATIQREKRRIFNHTDWSEGCKRYLEDIDGPYEAKDTSEWHYQQILALDAENQMAQQALKKIQQRKLLEFSSCDSYQHAVEKDPLKDLFQN